MQTTLELAANVRRAVMSLDVCQLICCGVVTTDWELCAHADSGLILGPVCHDCIRWDEAADHLLRVIDPETPKSFYERWAEFMRKENGEDADA